jgi:hypothetical protein
VILLFREIHGKVFVADTVGSEVAKKLKTQLPASAKLYKIGCKVKITY